MVRWLSENQIENAGSQETWKEPENDKCPSITDHTHKFITHKMINIIIRPSPLYTLVIWF